MDSVPIILDFSIQYKKIEQIIRRHWSVLPLDKQLQEVLPKHPNFIYRRAPTLRDKLVKNIPDPPTKGFTTFFYWQRFLCLHKN